MLLLTMALVPLMTNAACAVDQGPFTTVDVLKSLKGTATAMEINSMNAVNVAVPEFQRVTATAMATNSMPLVSAEGLARQTRTTTGSATT